MNKGIPAHILVERLDFLLTRAELEANAGNAVPAAALVTEARSLVTQLRGAVTWT